MNSETGVNRQASGSLRRRTRAAGEQLSLALSDESQREGALRAAWASSRLHLPYHAAMRSRPLAICLNCLAEAMQKRAALDGRAALNRRGARRRNK